MIQKDLEGKKEIWKEDWNQDLTCLNQGDWILELKEDLDLMIPQEDKKETCKEKIEGWNPGTGFPDPGKWTEDLDLLIHWKGKRDICKGRKEGWILETGFPDPEMRIVDPDLRIG